MFFANKFNKTKKEQFAAKMVQFSNLHWCLYFSDMKSIICSRIRASASLVDTFRFSSLSCAHSDRILLDHRLHHLVIFLRDWTVRKLRHTNCFSNFKRMSDNGHFQKKSLRRNLQSKLSVPKKKCENLCLQI